MRESHEGKSELGPRLVEPVRILVEPVGLGSRLGTHDRAWNLFGRMRSTFGRVRGLVAEPVRPWAVFVAHLAEPVSSVAESITLAERNPHGNWSLVERP